MRTSLLLVLAFAYALNIQAKADKLRVIWNNDPGTTMTIGWNQVSGKFPKVEYSAQAGARVIREATPSCYIRVCTIILCAS